jgi:hypothetical protein
MREKRRNISKMQSETLQRRDRVGDLKNLMCDGVGWINLTSYSDKPRDCITTVMNILGPIEVGN